MQLSPITASWRGACRDVRLHGWGGLSLNTAGVHSAQTVVSKIGGRLLVQGAVQAEGS